LGPEKLGGLEYHESIDEMKHADKLIKRTLLLEGLPNVEDLGYENTAEMLACDLKIEHIAHVDLKEAIAYCENIADYASRELLREVLCSKEDHIDWLETQIRLIGKVGLQNYLQSQMDE
jgi:bacterioferritin